MHRTTVALSASSLESVRIRTDGKGEASPHRRGLGRLLDALAFVAQMIQRSKHVGSGLNLAVLLGVVGAGPRSVLPVVVELPKRDARGAALADRLSGADGRPPPIQSALGFACDSGTMSSAGPAVMTMQFVPAVSQARAIETPWLIVLISASSRMR